MYDAVAAQLCRLRKEHGFSQDELAQRLGVSRQAISKWEQGRALPDTAHLLDLARLYGCTLDELIQPAQAAASSMAGDAIPAEGSAGEGSRSEAAVPAAPARFRQNVPYPVLVTAAYLVLGFAWDLWHPGWIIFLTIPLFYLPDNQRGYGKLLGNPVMVTIIYLLLGFCCNLWHPGWLVFLLIPLLGALQGK